MKVLENIWGDTPKIWNPDLKGYKRSRTIINYFTRMRFLGKDGSLKLKAKKNKADEMHIPWFNQTINNLKDNQYIILVNLVLPSRAAQCPKIIYWLSFKFLIVWLNHGICISSALFFFGLQF